MQESTSRRAVFIRFELLQQSYLINLERAFMDKLLTVKEVAEILGISRSTAKIWASKRKLPVVKVGRLLRVRPEALEEYIKRNSEWKRVVTGTQCQSRPKRPPKNKSFDSYVERVKTEKNGEAEESI